MPPVVTVGTVYKQHTDADAIRWSDVISLLSLCPFARVTADLYRSYIRHPSQDKRVPTLPGSLVTTSTKLPPALTFPFLTLGNLACFLTFVIVKMLHK